MYSGSRVKTLNQLINIHRHPYCSNGSSYPLDWSFVVYLIEIDNIHTNVVCSNIELNGIVLKAKQDTGAQINVLSKTMFQTLQKSGKLPLYPKTCVKLVGYGNKTINYLGTTKIKCNHNGTEIDAIFYVTDVPDTKIILGLRLCIDLGLIVIQCDNECRCKNVQVVETSSSTPIENVQGSDDKSSALPPVPLNTKIDETNLKPHVMQLYPDLFDGVWTIKNAVVHLDIKPGAIPIVCSPRRVPDALRNSLKEKLDRMESMKVIWKLDINEACNWVHALVLVVKPNGKLHACLDPHTLNSVLRHNIHNAQRFVDIITQIRGFTHCSKIDANSGFWTLPLDAMSQLLTTFDKPWGQYCFLKLPFGLCEL